MLMRLQSESIILAVILTEAIISLLFTATVLQPFRELLIRIIPLRVRDEHLLECKICSSFWVGIFCFLLVSYSGGIFYILLCGIVVHRLSNYTHLVYSIVRDKQFDMRVNRK